MRQNKSNDKPFLSYQEQIYKLKNEKNCKSPMNLAQLHY